MEKEKLEVYLEGLAVVDDGDGSSAIDIGDLLPTPWFAKDYLATGPDVHPFNPRAKGNKFDTKALKKRAKIKERAFGRFCGKMEC